MADTTTTGLQILLQETGSHDNAWGTLLNQGLQKLEDAICSGEAINLASGGLTLTNDQARQHVLILTGTLTANATIVVPARYKTWIVLNYTAGNFLVFIKCAGEATGWISSRDRAEHLFCDTQSVRCVGDNGQVPIGAIIDYSISVLPPSYLPCNGGAVSRGEFGRLFAVIGTTWGGGDGTTTFNLPNAIDRYRRGSGTAGLYLAQETAAHSHSAVIGGVGDHTHSISTEGAHFHVVTGSGGPGGIGTGVGFQSLGQLAATNEAGAHTHTAQPTGGHTHGITIGSTGGGETRPNSLTTLPLIRYQ